MIESRRIHLVRHGITEWNRAQRYQGHIDVPLSDEGRQQAVAVGERLKLLPLRRCFSSDLARAFETAKVIASRCGIDVEPDPDLREASKGALEGKHWDASTGFLHDESGVHDEFDLNARPPGGESVLDLRVRCERFVQRVRDRDQTIPDGICWSSPMEGRSVRCSRCCLNSPPKRSSTSGSTTAV